MITEITDNKFDRKLVCSDWRYSATVVGMIRFMKDKGIDYKIESDELGQDALYYYSKDVIGKKAEEAYLDFAQDYFNGSMHHLILKELLEKDELNDDQIKIANEKLGANAILKKVFEKEKYNLENKEELLQRLTNHRMEIIRETYRNGMSMYRNFSNTGCLGLEKGNICRLNGYYIDLGKKSKSAAFYWDFSTYTAQDEPEFDYIPFAFTRSYESFFINNNFSIKKLLQANENIKTLLGYKENPRTCLFGQTEAASAFIEYEVEVIVKERELDYFMTLFVRKEAIKIFEAIGNDYDVLTKPCKVDKEYIPVEKTVTDAVLNGVHLDGLIEKLLKSGEGYHTYLIGHLIKINQLLYGNGGEQMNQTMKGAYGAAKQVVEVFKKNKHENKINTYRQKLISAITFHDYDRYNEILLQLSAYSEVPFNFAFDLFEDFEQHKNLAYTFVNALNDTKPQEEKNNEK